MATLQDALEQLPLLKKAQDAAFRVNLACERLVAMGKFTGLLVPVKLVAHEAGTITLPGDLETLVGATTNGEVQTMHDPWFEFAPRPNYPVAPDPRFYAADLGDRHVTYKSVVGAEVLRFVLWDTADAELIVSITVRSTEDQGIRSEQTVIEGRFDDLSTEFSGPFFGGIDGVVKMTKPRTGGWVSLQARFDGIWTEVGRFGPRDTDIRFRRYSIPSVKEGDIVQALCKKRFRPVEDLSDELPIDSIYCLRMAIEALLSETEGDLEKAQNFWGLARKGLSDALSEHRSSALRTLPVYCRAAAGAKLRAIR